MKDVAVIIINYNTSAYTLKCIQSVVTHTPLRISFEIIVVDNNSQIDDFKKLSDNFPKEDHISLYKSDINTGFGGGNMYGAKRAMAKYLLFLNNDAFLQNDCLTIMLNFMDLNSKVGVATAQNYNENNEHVPSFDHFKGLRRLLFGRGFLEKMNSKKYPKRQDEYFKPIEVNWVNGAFMFFNSDIFYGVNGFDTNIFLYYEEMDICQRLLDKGFKSALVPEAKIVHYQGASTGLSKKLNKESYISYLYVIRKNYGWMKQFLIRVYLIFVIIFKPKKWNLFKVIINPSNSKSLRNQQVAN